MTKTMLLAMLLSGGLDFASTEYAKSRGLYEANPLPSAVSYGLNVAAPVALYFAFRDKPVAGKWAARTYIGIKLGVSARNFYLGATVRW